MHTGAANDLKIPKAAYALSVLDILTASFAGRTRRARAFADG
jgi:hypothetical protein